MRRIPLSPRRQRLCSSTHIQALERLIAVLQQELSTARERETTLLREAHDRETLLLQMLSQAHQQNQRLLDLPRGTAIPPPSSQIAPGSTQPPAPRQRTPVAPQTPPGDPRGAMRRRILALLQDHPEGLTPAEMRRLLGVERSLADTCLGMRRDGVVQRVGRGKYVAAEPSGSDQT